MAFKDVIDAAEKGEPSSNPVKQTGPTNVTSPSVPRAKYQMKNGIKVFHLNAESVKQEVSKGVYMKGWGYKGERPSWKGRPHLKAHWF